MPKSLRVFIAFSFIALVIAPFTNCGEYAEPANSDVYSSVLECDEDCVMPTAENLSIKANLGGGNQYDVPANLTEWNLGGDCNEGGYPENQIRWELYLNGSMVRHSGMTGMAGNNPVHGRCINGRFLLYINVGAIAGDPVDRTGLRIGSGSLRSAYDLYIEIYGQDMVNDPSPARNSTKGRQRLTLTAI